MGNASRLAAVLAAFFVSGLSLPAAAQTQQFLVDCAAGMTIASALKQGDSRKPLVLTIRGQCNENVTITRDDVTLRGDSKSWGVVNGPSSTIPTIDILAHRVTVDWLTITGGQEGIMIHGALNAVVTGSTIQHTGREGIKLLGGHARILNSAIRYAGASGVWFQSSHALLSNNIIEYNAGSGVYLHQTSNVNAFGNTITANASNGVELLFNSHGSFYANSINGNGTGAGLPQHGIEVRYATAVLFDGNQVSNNNGVGVRVVAGQASITNSTITANKSWGLTGDLGSNLEINGGLVSGNSQGGIAMRMRSNLQLANVAINSNLAYAVRLRLGSALMALPPASNLTNNVGYDLVCTDTESSFTGPMTIGSIDPACTGF